MRGTNERLKDSKQSFIMLLVVLVTWVSVLWTMGCGGAPTNTTKNPKDKGVVGQGELDFYVWFSLKRGDVTEEQGSVRFQIIDESKGFDVKGGGTATYKISTKQSNCDFTYEVDGAVTATGSLSQECRLTMQFEIVWGPSRLTASSCPWRDRLVNPVLATQTFSIGPMPLVNNSKFPLPMGPSTAGDYTLRNLSVDLFSTGCTVN
jgi:hypothetical protein